VKFQVEKPAFNDAVGWAARTLPTRPATPTLAGLLIEANNGELELSTFDFATSAKASVKADVFTPGKVLVNGRILADIVKALPNKPITIEISGSRVELTCDRSNFLLPTIPDHDYPALPSLPTTGGNIETNVFAEAVTMVAVAAGMDSTLPMLTGIKVEISGNSLTFAATDRYRLAVKEISWQPDTPNIEINALIPAKNLADAARTLTGENVRLTFSSNDDGEKLIGIEAVGKKMTSRLLDAEFPKYKTLLPTESSTIVTLNTQSLMDSVKRVALVADRNSPVRCNFENGEVILTAGNGDDPTATEVVECEINGEGIEIAFNHQYLIDGLNAVGSDSTQLMFTSQNRPAVLAAAGSTTPNYKYLLMPVRLNG
jgi:DNA polymerase-3 subunit beta